MQGLPCNILQPRKAPQGLAAKLSSKRHRHLRLCWPNAGFHPWKNEALDLENNFLELQWGLRMRPHPDLWGSVPECPSTISTGGSSQACAKLYACGNGVWNDVKVTSSCEEQPVFGDPTTRPGSICGSGAIYCTFKIASKHAQHSAISWAELLGCKLERPGSPTWEEAPKPCLVMRTG